MTFSVRGARPLVGWGTPADLNAWTSGNTPVITTGVADPFGGTSAVTIEDNDGALVEYKQSPTVTLLDDPPGGELDFIVFIKEGTASASTLRLRKASADTTILAVTITWATPSAAVISGTGSVLGFFPVGESDWYCLLIQATSVVQADNLAIQCYGATSTGSTTGSTTWYVRNALVMNPLDGAIAYARPWNYTSVRSHDGVETAWDQGLEQVLNGVIRHIPGRAEATPYPVSGWDGRNEAAGVNASVDAWVQWARDQQTFVWWGDRTVDMVRQTSTLLKPQQGRPSLERDPRYRRLGVTIRGDNPFVGY